MTELKENKKRIKKQVVKEKERVDLPKVNSNEVRSTETNVERPVIQENYGQVKLACQNWLIVAIMLVILWLTSHMLEPAIDKLIYSQFISNVDSVEQNQKVIQNDENYDENQ